MRSQTKGYITVFLSLSIMIILSLVLALYQGARIGAVRMKTECVADIAMNSVLAEYDRELFEQYSLLLVDSSYGLDKPSIINTREQLRYYTEKNFERSTYGGLANAQTMTAMECRDVNLTGFLVATDCDGAVLNRQILSYMAAEPVGSVMTDVLENLGRLKEAEIDSTDIDELASENQEKIDSAELPTYENDEGQEEEVSIGNPADTVNSLRGTPVLNLAIDDISRVSGAVVNVGALPSGRTLNKGSGLDAQEEISLTEQLLLDEYYYEKCSRYGHELEKSLLKYQLEYLAFGEDSDYKNLEKEAQRLFLWREAANMLYLMSDSQKVSEAEELASALSIVVLLPELEEPLKYSILLAWTFAESVSDLRILFNGGKVPLLKDDSSWKMSLSQMLDFKKNVNASDNENGLTYEDYLRIQLLMTDSSKKTKRMMDVIEMDIRNTEGKSGFRLDYCIDELRAEFIIDTKYGYETKIERTYGYEY